MNISEGIFLQKLIQKRQSDRGYSTRPVEQDKLDRIIESGRLAPSACNSQPWKFVVVTDPDIRAKVAEAATAKALGMNTFVNQAPVLIVVIREKSNFTSKTGGLIKNKDYSVMDIGIASGFMTLQACAEGLGSCLLGWFNEKLVKKILGIPAGKRVELIITIGYSAKEPREKKRKPLAEVSSENKY